MTMHCTLLSLFPEWFNSPLDTGLMARARTAGLLSFDFVNPRDFSKDAHHSVDDRPYGGGPGMVMMPDPVSAALRSIPASGRILLMSPKGRPMTQAFARELALESHLTFVCGRYEGLDARLEELFPLEAVSVGDMVLNGGECAALTIIEACARLIPGFMGKEDSGTEESFSAGLLEYPHYTRPEEFEGLTVPEVLRSGNHARIAQWRREQSLQTTLKVRPDLLENAPLSEQDHDFLAQLPRLRAGRNLYCCLVHYPVLLKDKKSGISSLTNLDIHDIARSSCTYGLSGMYVTTPLEDQRKLLETLLDFWTQGAGARSNPDRAAALSLVRHLPLVEDVLEDLRQRTGTKPFVLGTSAQGAGSMTAKDVRTLLYDRPVLLILGTSHGLAPEVLALCDSMLRPLRGLDAYNHLSVRSAAAIVMDRILGDCY